MLPNLPKALNAAQTHLKGHVEGWMSQLGSKKSIFPLAQSILKMVPAAQPASKNWDFLTILGIKKHS
ncbi:hypothetical protein XELAEV_18043351mg [Xenopus laevis]|uniref:Uncharacterized protein n=1 Tax=Xenopus laevis TaxID=8355 RepID=A0A974H2C4_XENLA|nr:hypothetical protein XELAEV_18043351mg [Xenopus laevis]